MSVGVGTLAFDRQPQGEEAAFAQFRFDRQAAAVLFHQNRTRHSQALAGIFAGGLGGEKGLEQARSNG